MQQKFNVQTVLRKKIREDTEIHADWGDIILTT